MAESVKASALDVLGTAVETVRDWHSAFNKLYEPFQKDFLNRIAQPMQHQQAILMAAGAVTFSVIALSTTVELVRLLVAKKASSPKNNYMNENEMATLTAKNVNHPVAPIIRASITPGCRILVTGGSVLSLFSAKKTEFTTILLPLLHYQINQKLTLMAT